MTVEPQPAGPTFARSARVHDVRTYIYIYIYKKHIYIYDEDFSPLYDKCGARSARRLVTELASLAIIIYFYTCKGSFVHTQRVNAHLILFNAHWFAFTPSRRECALSQSGLKPVWLNPLREVV